MALVEGNYPQIKAGQDSTDGSGRFDVVFNTPFPGKGYSIQLSCRGLYIVTWKNKEATGFRIKSRTVSGANAIGVSVSWLAVKNVDD